MSNDVKETNNLDELWGFFKENLHEGNVSVTFRKADGTERVMLCTLHPESYGNYQFKTERKPGQGGSNPDVQAVWDVEKKGWRSVKKETIISVEVA